MYQRTEQEIMQNWKNKIDKPVVSITNNTYNHENYIAEAIESFLMQETDFPFEILVHDDCSTDNTANIIRKYEKKYPNIIKPIYQKENQYSKGIKISLTFNYPRAQGNYIASCEGDDCWTDPLKLQKQVDFLEKNDAYIITYHKTRKINEKGEFLADKVDAVDYDITADELKCAEKYIQTCTVVFRNVPLKYTEELQQAYNGDTVLWHLLSFYGKSKYMKNIDYAHYRIHQNGIWTKLDPVEKSLKSTGTKLLLLGNLKGEKILHKRLENSILQNFFDILFKSIKDRDTKQLKKLFYLIKNDKHIKTYKFITAFFSYFWKKLNSKLA